MESTLQFLMIVLALELTPGPAVMMILFQSALGMRHVAAAIAGLLVANVVWIVLVATGLGLVITQSPNLYAVLRIGGAAYLIYLGYKILRYGIMPPDTSHTRAVSSYRKSCLRGMLVSFSNPKALVFFMALFPPFVRPEHFAADIVYLGALKMLSLVFAQVLYSVMGRQIFAYLRGGKGAIWVPRLLGSGIMIGGLVLLVG